MPFGSKVYIPSEINDFDRQKLEWILEIQRKTQLGICSRNAFITGSDYDYSNDFEAYWFVNDYDFKSSIRKLSIEKESYVLAGLDFIFNIKPSKLRNYDIEMFPKYLNNGFCGFIPVKISNEEKYLKNER